MNLGNKKEERRFINRDIISSRDRWCTCTTSTCTIRVHQLPMWYYSSMDMQSGRQQSGLVACTCWVFSKDNFREHSKCYGIKK